MLLPPQGDETYFVEQAQILFHMPRMHRLAKGCLIEAVLTGEEGDELGNIVAEISEVYAEDTCGITLSIQVVACVEELALALQPCLPSQVENGGVRVFHVTHTNEALPPQLEAEKV